MKKIIFALAALTATSAAFAATSGDNASDTTSTSKNPITGSVTTTRKAHRKVKHGKNVAKLDVTEKTTTKKSGEVDKKVDASGSSTEK